MRTLVVSGLLAFLAAPPAGAGEHAVPAPGAPVSPAELQAAGHGTIAGTVTAIAGAGFTLAELTTAEPVAVAAGDLGLAGLAPGEPVTVTGTVEEGTLRARQIIRGDGSVATAGREAEDELADAEDEEED
ncbi:hypothetical protein [Benzoatithermus flavus]|uniref:DUF5666 domain-containing protein n=1 Tax=Benzoatithermus flavus TaxID=3108223 RepID=A0ABU8XW14_9PROT